MNVSDIFKSQMQERLLEPSTDLWDSIEKRMGYSDEYLQQEGTVEQEQKQGQEQEQEQSTLVKNIQ